MKERLTPEQENNKEKFFYLLDRMDSVNRSVTDQSEDLKFLKATYKPEMEYKVTFKHNSDRKNYIATFKNGTLESLYPKNKDLQNDIAKYPIDTLTYEPVDYTISNEASIARDRATFEIAKVHYDRFDFQSDMQAAMNNTNSIEKFEMITTIGESLAARIREEKVISDNLDLYLDATKNVTKELSSFERQELETDIDFYKHLSEDSIKSLNEFENAQQLIGVLKNQTFQQIREEGRIPEFFKDHPLSHENQLTFIGKNVPFTRGFEDRLMDNISLSHNDVRELAITHAIQEPTEQIKHHMNNYKLLEEQSLVTSMYDYETTFRLKEESFNEMDKAFNIAEKTIKNEMKIEEPFKLNREVYLIPKFDMRAHEVLGEREEMDAYHKVFSEKQNWYKEAFETLRPIPLMQEEDLSLINILERSQNYSEVAVKYWGREVLSHIDNQLELYTNEQEHLYSLVDADKNIEYIKANEYSNPEYREQYAGSLDTFKRAIAALEHQSGFFNGMGEQKEKQNIIAMKDFLSEKHVSLEIGEQGKSFEQISWEIEQEIADDLRREELEYLFPENAENPYEEQDELSLDELYKSQNLENER
ncbi:hypothetical protein [Terribacillus saccharophilus]|uniref:hypothetical protein n=1 Tax=Terribacillus saccharophilus TaxID=361277 RepID=UPI002989C8F9|nr:hypothetical protein [Terribacillus saccharophilus]MCM3227573.1 hypothetical protein [Terribacillus saccharophilus]